MVGNGKLTALFLVPVITLVLDQVFAKHHVQNLDGNTERYFYPSFWHGT
jgi:hypothetical protein